MNRRDYWSKIIFESETQKGKAFDIVLFIVILGSLITIMLETVESIAKEYHIIFRVLEWIFTILFSFEYIMRIIVAENKRRYILSFYGIIDLLSVLPTYLVIILSGAQYFLMIRSLRLLRVFRVLKMVRFLGEAKVLLIALRASRAKIIVFLIAVLCVVFIMGALMYMIEGKENGFKSIPVSIYWCIVTLTTVGYGDISPQTPLGQIIASIIMILGYGIIAVPTGIVTSELATTSRKKKGRCCLGCSYSPISSSDNFCPNCGIKL